MSDLEGRVKRLEDLRDSDLREAQLQRKIDQTIADTRHASNQEKLDSIGESVARISERLGIISISEATEAGAKKQRDETRGAILALLTAAISGGGIATLIGVVVDYIKHWGPFK